MTRLTRLLRTSTFRLSVVYLGLFVLSVVTVLAYIYLNTSVLLARQTNETIDAEITGLAEQYRSGGLQSLVRIVAERSRSRDGGVYLLSAPGGAPLAGNISAMPPSDDDFDWIEFAYRSPPAGDAGEPETGTALARHFRLAGDFRLLVGRDIGAQRNFEALIRSTFIWALGLTLLLGLVGGLMMSRGFLARIENMTRTSQTIIAGDLSRRVPIAGSDDEIDRLAGSLNDMLDEIERLMAVARQVTDNIAHDLRTPLSRIRARIEDVLRSRQDEETYRAVLRSTLDDADRLLATFNALLSIARIESGVDRDALATIDVSAALADAVELYQPLAEDAGIGLAVEISDGLKARGDRQLIGQALANLIDNAIKYSTPVAGRDARQPAPAVAVSGRRVGSRLEIIVADNGPGIAAADRGRVFTRFVRLEESRSAPGSGLGLSLVAAVAKLHGGSVRLDDNRPGLRAIIDLPAAD